MTTVAVLGTGIMGSAMARSLSRAGNHVRVWNRTQDKTHPLSREGIEACRDPRTAVTGADAVITMMFDGPAVEGVMSEAVDAMGDGTIWIQATTIGVHATTRCATLAARAGVAFVDAPVLGTKDPAEKGKLVVLASAPVELREIVAPVLDAVSSRIIWVGQEPGDGHRLKLAVNSWVISLVGITAQAVALTRASGLDPALFLDAISGGPTDCAYAQMKGNAMIAGEFPAAFTLRGAVKDSELIAAALRDNAVDDLIMTALHALLVSAAADGHANEDMAAIITALDRPSHRAQEANA